MASVGFCNSHRLKPVEHRPFQNTFLKSPLFDLALMGKIFEFAPEGAMKSCHVLKLVFRDHENNPAGLCSSSYLSVIASKKKDCLEAYKRIGQVMESILQSQYALLEAQEKRKKEIEEQNNPGLPEDVQKRKENLEDVEGMIGRKLDNLEKRLQKFPLLKSWMDLGKIIKQEIILAVNSVSEKSLEPSEFVKSGSSLYKVGVSWWELTNSMHPEKLLEAWFEFLFCHNTFLYRHESTTPDCKEILGKMFTWAKAQMEMRKALRKMQRLGLLGCVISLAKEVPLKDFISLYANAFVRGDLDDLRALEASKIFERYSGRIVGHVLWGIVVEAYQVDIEKCLILRGFDKISNHWLNCTIERAAEKGNLRAVKFLMNHPLYQPDSLRVNLALSLAIHYGHDEVVLYMGDQLSLRSLCRGPNGGNQVFAGLVDDAERCGRLEVRRIILDQKGICTEFPNRIGSLLKAAALVGHIPTVEMVLRRSRGLPIGDARKFGPQGMDFIGAIQVAEEAGHSEFAERLRASPVFSRHPRALIEATISTLGQVGWARAFQFAIFESRWLPLAASGASLPLLATAYAVSLLVSALLAKLGQWVIARNGALVSPAATRRFLISNFATGFLAHLDRTRIGVLYPHFLAASFLVTWVANLYFAFQMRDYRPELLPAR